MIPYYFIGSLAVLPVLVFLCRVIRLKVAINALVGGAIVICVAGIAVPLACDWVDLAAFTGRPMLVLVLMSIVFSAADAALTERLPLPLDKDLNEL